MPEVTVYTNPNCIQCDMTKKHLDKNSIPYSVVDLSTNADALKMVTEMGFTSAPVVFAGEQKWAGYRHGHLEHLSSQFRTEKKTA